MEEQNTSLEAKRGQTINIARKKKAVLKILYTIFFIVSGPVIQVATPKSLSVTKSFEECKCLKQVVEHYQKICPTSGTGYTKILHDNTMSDKSAIVQDYLKSEKMQDPPQLSTVLTLPGETFSIPKAERNPCRKQVPILLCSRSCSFPVSIGCTHRIVLKGLF